MASSIPPVVRHFFVCDEATTDPINRQKADVRGLVHSITVPNEVAFPFIIPKLTFYLALTEGRGQGMGQIAVVNAETEELAFASRIHELRFSTNPLDVFSLIFRVRHCPFQTLGLFWAEFRYNGETLARQPLLVRIDE